MIGVTRAIIFEAPPPPPHSPQINQLSFIIVDILLSITSTLKVIPDFEKYL